MKLLDQTMGKQAWLTERNRERERVKERQRKWSFVYNLFWRRETKNKLLRNMCLARLIFAFLYVRVMYACSYKSIQ